MKTMQTMPEDLAVADVFACLGHEARLAILRGLDEDRSMPDVADEIGMQRGTLQDHIERLIRCRLVYRPGDEARTYALTPFGEDVVAWLDGIEPELEQRITEVTRAEREIREELESAPLADGEVEQVVQRELWQRLAEED